MMLGIVVPGIMDEAVMMMGMVELGVLVVDKAVLLDAV